MRVLMVISYPEFGGTETHVLSLCRMLRASGVQVGIATFGGPFVPCFRNHMIPVHYMTKNGKSHSLKAVSEIVSIARKHKYDLVHGHDSESFNMFPRLKRALPRIPLVMTVHGVYYSRHELRRAARAATLIIAVSPFVQRWVVHRAAQPAQKVCWIPNGIDTQKYSPTDPVRYKRLLKLPPTAKVCLYAGRFQSDKLHIAQKFIIAAERVSVKYNNFVALLVGFGSYRHHLTQMAKKANARIGRVAIWVLPHTTHMENYYRASTMVVGTGRVALEALACGKPVIAAGLAGYDGIVTPTRLNGVIADHFGDHAAQKSINVDRLTNDMTKLLTSSEIAKRWGGYGRKVVRHRFSIRRIGSITHRAYLNVKR